MDITSDKPFDSIVTRYQCQDIATYVFPGYTLIHGQLPRSYKEDAYLVIRYKL